MSITKSAMYDVIAAVLTSADFDEKAEALEFIAHEKDMLAAKSEKAKARAAEKRAESEVVYDKIMGLMTSDLQTIDDILVKLEDESMTPAKVSARVSRLVKAGLVEKESIKVGDKKRMAYRIA